MWRADTWVIWGFSSVAVMIVKCQRFFDLSLFKILSIRLLKKTGDLPSNANYVWKPKYPSNLLTHLQVGLIVYPFHAKSSPECECYILENRVSIEGIEFDYLDLPWSNSSQAFSNSREDFPLKGFGLSRSISCVSTSITLAAGTDDSVSFRHRLASFDLR